MISSKILIFEDEFIPANDLKRQLTKMGYNVLGLFVKAEQGLEYMEKNKVTENFPDAVLMDITLKGHLDGTEAFKIITEKYDCGVVFLTGLSQFELIEEVFKIRPVSYLIKPFDILQVHICLQLAIYQAKLEKEIKSLRKELRKK